MELSSYLAPKLSSVFTQLPAFQDMRVGWRQFLTPAGNLIEDFGVKADHVLVPNVDDFNPEAVVFSYLEKISDVLYQQSLEEGRQAQCILSRGTFLTTSQSK